MEELLVLGLLFIGIGVFGLFIISMLEGRMKRPKSQQPVVSQCSHCGKEFTIPSEEYVRHLQTEHPREFEVDRLFALVGKMLINHGNRMVQAGIITPFAPQLGFQEATTLAVEKTRMWENIEGLLRQAYSIHPEYTKRRIEMAIANSQRNTEMVAQLTRILSSLEVGKARREEEISAKSETLYYAPSEPFYQTSYQFKISDWKEEKPKEESKVQKEKREQ